MQLPRCMRCHASTAMKMMLAMRCHASTAMKMMLAMRCRVVLRCAGLRQDGGGRSERERSCTAGRQGGDDTGR